MYPPATSYEIYKVERGLALTDAERRAADQRAGEVAAAMRRQSRALARLVTLAWLGNALRRREVLGRRSTSPIAPGTPRPRSASTGPLAVHSVAE